MSAGSEDVQGVVAAMRTVANAITPIGAAPARMPDGAMVGSLTEAVISAACGMHEIASAIRDLARAVREHGGTT